MDSDNWFWCLSVAIFVQFVKDIFLAIKGIERRLKSQVHILFSEKKTHVKTPLSEMKMCASQYIMKLFEEMVSM